MADYTALTPGQFNKETPIAPAPTKAVTSPYVPTPTPAPTPTPTPTAGLSSIDQPTYVVKAGDKFNPYNGQPLNNAPVGTTIQNPFGIKDTVAKVSPEDQKLLDMGITPDQLKQLNTPEGMDPGSFQALIGNVENKLKTNNELVTQRGYLIKHLYDSPLTKDELKALPDDIQKIIKTGDQDTIQLQIRLLNDQIAGRANTLSQSIGYLSEGYKTSVQAAEKQKTDAVNTVLDFVDKYGSKASTVLSSLYGPQYLDKLKEMGIDINNLSNISTLAQDKANSKSGGGDTGGTLTERTQHALSVAQEEIVPGAKLPDGTPVIDANGFITPKALKAYLLAAQKHGVSREDFLKQFASMIYSEGGVVSKEYGLSPSEIKAVTG